MLTRAARRFGARRYPRTDKQKAKQTIAKSKITIGEYWPFLINQINAGPVVANVSTIPIIALKEHSNIENQDRNLPSLTREVNGGRAALGSGGKSQPVSSIG
jgi:hypothetical protein